MQEVLDKILALQKPLIILDESFVHALVVKSVLDENSVSPFVISQNQIRIFITEERT